MSGGFPTVAGGICNDQDVGSALATTTSTSVAIGTGVYGSWVQLIASLPFDCEFCIAQASFSSGPTFGCLWKIGIGSAGSEVPIVSDIPLSTATGTAGLRNGMVPFPISIPAGSRVSVAAKGNSGDAAAFKCNFLDSAFGTGGIAGYDGFQSSVRATSITPNATADVKGTWVQFNAGTIRDYAALLLMIDMNSATFTANYMIDIAIGAAGSELPILNNLLISANQSPSAPILIPIEIPANTRISARCQCSAASGTVVYLTMAGGYE